MELNSIKQTIKNNLCIGCGLCEMDKNISMEIIKGMLRPNLVTKSHIIDYSCPAKGYNLLKEGQKIFGNIQYCHELGYYRQVLVARSTNSTILKNASSGGVITQIAASMLSMHIVDGVITNRFYYKDNIVRSEVYIASTEKDLLDGQGSKYCPTSTLTILKQLDHNKKYLLIGTPCQIAGFRRYSDILKEYKEIVPYTIANFCGGYRDYRELDYFVNHLAHIKQVSFFRHRGGGQPGSMLINGTKGESFKYPYPDYSKLSPIIKNERCSLCMDATGELADFSCGDAWLEQLQNGPWSIVLARSEFAQTFLQDMVREGSIVLGDQINESKVIESQISNITSKKYRQYKRIKVRKSLMLPSPCWYNNFPIKNGSYLQELKIILSKKKAELLAKLKNN